MPQIDSAEPMLLSRLTGEAAGLHGRKVRFVGWYLACDLDTILVAHAGHGVLVDISACLHTPAAGERGGSSGLAFLSERKRKVMVFGDVDVQTDALAIPAVSGASAREAGGAVDGRVVVRAVLVREVDGLSLEEWERGLASLEARPGFATAGVAQEEGEEGTSEGIP
ncbi:hypothetical protein CALCODRAFT_482945 [Calocera cornea HHB12733]|uniref:Uncharacterized protein n=1 Tax=Calocera cornea HHB12733 TaxID=1353952 RepID=A0A165G9U8_9BASI|nr:hypothetical protein CALCODRAFT_482945 [Calocera cornea HHB12733]